MNKKILFLLPLLGLLLTGCKPEEVPTSKTSSNAPESSLSVSESGNEPSISSTDVSSESTSNPDPSTSTTGSYVELPFI